MNEKAYLGAKCKHFHNNNPQKECSEIGTCVGTINSHIVHEHLEENPFN